MKVLFFNPANYLEIGIPQGIAILSAALKRDGHQVELFDTALLKPQDYAVQDNDIMVSPAIFKQTAYTLEDLVKDDTVSIIEDEFQKHIDRYNPGLVAVSTMTSNYDCAIDIMKKVKIKCPVIFGGVHATICPEEVISEYCIDMICIGEGEEALAELCNAMEQGTDYRGIRNLWVKSQNGKLYKNGMRPFVNLDSLPCPDWSIFDSRHLFRPFMGEIYKGGFYISTRGCPGACTYCVNPTLKKKFKNDSFRADNGPYKKGEDAVKVIGKYITLPKIGKIKMAEKLRFSGQVKSTTVSRIADRWFVSISVDTIAPKIPSNRQEVVGVDLDVKTLATFSTGTIKEIDNPRGIAKKLKHLRRLNKNLSRTKKGSKKIG